MLFIRIGLQEITAFTNAELSSFYFDISKDRLYADARDGASRRAVQFVLVEVALFRTVDVNILIDLSYVCIVVGTDRMPSHGRSFSARQTFFPKWQRTRSANWMVHSCCGVAKR